MIEGGYESKVIYLKNVLGEEIVQEQEKINCSDEMKVVATQIMQSDDKHRFHAFIYYKVRAGTIANTHTQDGQHQQIKIKV
jgi:hypothetical protein